MVRKKTLRRIEAINSLFGTYGTMTLRQIYYRLLGTPEGTKYANIGYVCKIGRRQGYISYGNIVDRSRPIYSKKLWDGLEDFLSGAPYDFNLDFWKDSPIRPTIWTEKDALSQVLYEIAAEYNLSVYVTRGFLSISNKAKWGGDVVLYFGDFDPSGLCIDEDLEGEINTTEFRRIALTLEQIKEHDLPGVPVKNRDPRTPYYRSRYGNTCWELDALPPDVLRNLLRTTIEEYVDFDLQQKEDEEQKARTILHELMDAWEADS